MSLISIFQILVGFAIVLVGFILLILFVKSSPFRPRLRIWSAIRSVMRPPRANTKRYHEVLSHHDGLRRHWERITRRAETGLEAELRLALLEADSLIDDMLKRYGCPGKDMGERLKSLHPNALSEREINRLWEVHKLRNRIAHENGFHLSSSDAASALAFYHTVLEKMMAKELERI